MKIEQKDDLVIFDEFKIEGFIDKELNTTLLKRILYFTYWIVFMVIYEEITLLLEPWGYFNYGWWKLEYSILVDPILLIILLNFYKWIYKIEKSYLTSAFVEQT